MSGRIFLEAVEDDDEDLNIFWSDEVACVE